MGPTYSSFAFKIFFLQDGLPGKAHKIHLSGFEIRIFPLLGGLPAKAHKIHLPGFEIRVGRLLGEIFCEVSWFKPT